MIGADRSNHRATSDAAAMVTDHPPLLPLLGDAGLALAVALQCRKQRLVSVVGDQPFGNDGWHGRVWPLDKGCRTARPKLHGRLLDTISPSGRANPRSPSRSSPCFAAAREATPPSPPEPGSTIGLATRGARTPRTLGRPTCFGRPWVGHHVRSGWSDPSSTSGDRDGVRDVGLRSPRTRN